MLFQKFQQLGGANQRKTGGTGLGLAICREIIEQHDGEIWVESEHGKGSEFKFTLPIKSEYKILVIDDETMVLDLCDEILRRNGYIVLRSDKGMEGVKIAQEANPHLIVLDMKLSDTSGYEVIGRLRSSNATAAVPILVMSGYEEEIKKIRAEKCELDLPWISKPFSNEEFLSRVRGLVKK